MLLWGGSVARTIAVWWILRPMPDLWLTCDHFVCKMPTTGQPTRPTLPSIPLGSVNE